MKEKKTNASIFLMSPGDTLAADGIPEQLRDGQQMNTTEGDPSHDPDAVGTAFLPWTLGSDIIYIWKEREGRLSS